MKLMNNALVLVLTAALLLSMSALAFADAQSATASAQGLEETVTVTVTLEDGVITAIEAATDKEDATVGRQPSSSCPLPW